MQLSAFSTVSSRSIPCLHLHIIAVASILLLYQGSASASPKVAASVASAEDLAPPRKVPLANTHNTRDLGGYAVADGRRVKWGMLYRSDSLAELDEADVSILGELGLSRVTDFRSEEERQVAPDRLPRQTPPIVYRTVGVNNPALDVAELHRKFLAGELGSEELIALTDRRAYVSDEILRAKWGQWLRDMATPGALPQMFHCTAGKDRTGYAAALVLLALGVSREDVMRDFLLSNDYLQPRIEGGLAHFAANSEANIDPQLLRQVLGVTPTSLTGAFDAMEARYGSIDAYIEDGLGVDADTRLRLQSLLLE